MSSTDDFIPFLSDFPLSQRCIVADLFARVPSFSSTFHKHKGYYVLETSTPNSFPYAQTVSKFYNSVQRLQNERKKPKSKVRTLGWILRIINEMYDTRVNQYDKHHPSDPLPSFLDHVYSFIKTKFGVSGLLTKFEEDFLNTLKVYSTSNSAVNLFRSFLLSSSNQDTSVPIYGEVELSRFLLARSRIKKHVNPPRTVNKRSSLPHHIDCGLSRLPPSLCSNSDPSLLIPTNSLKRVAFVIGKEFGHLFVNEFVKRCVPLCTSDGISSDVFLKIYVECLVDFTNVEKDESDLDIEDFSTQESLSGDDSNQFSITPLDIDLANNSSVSIEDLLSVDISPMSKNSSIDEHESLQDYMVRSVNLALQSPKLSSIDGEVSEGDLIYEYEEDSESDSE
ncbi:hypothetical protein GEMRC1_008055 [Eukaryota sp. GEM-RC1]